MLHIYMLVLLVILTILVSLSLQVYGPNKAMAEVVDIIVKQEGHKLSVTGSTVDMSIASEISVEVEIPIVHNINLLTTGQGNISCQDMVGIIDRV